MNRLQDVVLGDKMERNLLIGLLIGMAGFFVGMLSFYTNMGTSMIWFGNGVIWGSNFIMIMALIGKERSDE